MKNSVKIYSLLLCLVLVLTVFSACGKKESNTMTTETTTLETTTAPLEDITHDKRLIGTWNGEMEYPITEDGKTVVVGCLVEIRKNGTMTLTMTKDQMREVYVKSLMVMTGVDNEFALDKALLFTTGKGLDETVDEMVAQLKDEDLVTTVFWETEDNNKLYEMDAGETKEDVTVETYTVSNDGNTVVITIEDEEMGTQKLTLKKVVE